MTSLFLFHNRYCRLVTAFRPFVFLGIHSTSVFFGYTSQKPDHLHNDERESWRARASDRRNCLVVCWTNGIAHFELANAMVTENTPEWQPGIVFVFTKEQQVELFILVPALPLFTFHPSSLVLGKRNQCSWLRPHSSSCDVWKPGKRKWNQLGVLFWHVWFHDSALFRGLCALGADLFRTFSGFNERKS